MYTVNRITLKKVKMAINQSIMNVTGKFTSGIVSERGVMFVVRNKIISRCAYAKQKVLG